MCVPKDLGTRTVQNTRASAARLRERGVTCPCAKKNTLTRSIKRKKKEKENKRKKQGVSRSRRKKRSVSFFESQHPRERTRRSIIIRKATTPTSFAGGATEKEGKLASNFLLFLCARFPHCLHNIKARLLINST